MKHKQALLSGIFVTLFFLISLLGFSQQRSIPSLEGWDGTVESSTKSPLTDWDYYNDFQDTSALNGMRVQNVDGNQDSDLIGLTLQLDFSAKVWLILHYTGDANYWAGSNSSFDTLEAADRWLITPMIVVSEFSSLEWKAQSVQLGLSATSETYEVYISTEGGDSNADFTEAPVFISNGTSTQWSTNLVTLEDFWGDSIWVGIRHTSFNQGLLAIDDLRVGYVHNPENGMLGDFEDVEAFASDLSPWTTLDLDSSAVYVFEGVNFPGAGQPMSFIAFNPTETNPAISGIDVFEGDQFGACFSAVAGPFGNAPNNDWLISPQSKIAENGKFSFYAKSFSHLWGWERFRVGISTSGNQPENFSYLNAGDYIEVDTAWTYFEYDLSAYANQEVYLAVQCVSDTAFVFCIDDIRIDSTGSIGIDETVRYNTEIFPNPTNGMLQVNRVEGSDISIFDMYGKEVYRRNSAGYKNSLNLQHLPVGVYLLKINSKQGSTVHKIIRT
jgi:hypothetical protein